MASRNELAEVFQDTMNWMNEDAVLTEAAMTAAERTQLYSAEDALPLPDDAKYRTTISVTGERSLAAALRLLKDAPEAKTAVLNFASATHPGGGVINGAVAQEECICRCTTLYPALAQGRLRSAYYDFHRSRHDSRYTDAVIFTPGVRIIKTDTERPERLPAEAHRTVDIITCAAPNKSAFSIAVTQEELKALFCKRIRRILTVAAVQGEEQLVLGAFGCGAFGNPPGLVAEAFREVLSEFTGCFAQVCFAVYCTPKHPENREAFEKVFGR